MASGPPVKISLDKKHLWIGSYCVTFEGAKQKAHEMLDLINGAEAEKEIKDAQETKIITRPPQG